jgi:hypothetical protein
MYDKEKIKILGVREIWNLDYWKEFYLKT